MAATPAQRAANRLNAAKPTGPKSTEGKDAARRNALKHGLTGAGVILPGEDAQEVTIREAAFRDQLVDEGDALGGALVRQMAIATIRVERAFRQETATAGARMRKAGEVFDDDRLVRAQEVLRDIAIDPVTIRRRLLVAPEGVDALIVRLRALRTRTESTRFVAWEDEEGKELDQILGNRPGQVPLSRAGMLTRGIAFDHWLGLDPAEFAGMEFEPRLYWAIGEVQKIIDAEIQFLQAHRASLDTTRRDQDRAEAAERQLLDLSKDGIALRRYAGAAERSMLKMLQELRLARAEGQERAITASLKAEASHCRNLVNDTSIGLDRLVCHGIGTPTPCAADQPEPHGVGVPIPWHPENYQSKDRLDATIPGVTRLKTIEVVAKSQVEAELGSFCSEPRDRSRLGSRSLIESLSADSGVSFAPIAIGRAPTRPGPVGS